MSNFRRFLMIKNENVEPVQTCCVYTTTVESQNVGLINRQQYVNKITLEDGTDVPITGTGALSYTFPEVGQHKVTIEFKEDVTDFSSCFWGCSSLTSIPENLFANNTAVTNFSYCFLGCTGLTSIPENLFTSNTAVANFRECFYACTSLTSIPENLFASNTAVTIFNGCFEDCSGITSIPENLFTSNTAVTEFSHCFLGCTSLISIPDNLFSNNTAVTSFETCFDGCSGLTGNCPKDNDGTPIYNRSGSGKPGYAIVTSYRYCFQGCRGLTDYSSIPSAWK